MGQQNIKLDMLCDQVFFGFGLGILNGGDPPDNGFWKFLLVEDFG